MRDHSSVLIDEFNGYYNRGDVESVPNDHSVEINNIQFPEESGISTRDGIDLYQSIGTAIDNVLRIHPYTMQTQQSLLVLRTGGIIDHVISSTVTHSAILTVATMTDFNVVSFGGRAYITPFATNASGQEVGISSEFLYVYQGAGVVARKAAGAPPTGTTLVANPVGGTFSDLGFHIFAVVYETDTGYLTALGPEIFATTTSVLNTVGFTISNIPIGPVTTAKRHIVATKAITSYNQDQDGYQFFFVPQGNIDNNTDTTKVVSFFDIDLLQDASHLIDNFSEIPAGVGLTLYHGRLVITTFPATATPPPNVGTKAADNISIAYLSHPGEPEAIDQVDGLLIVPLDGNPLTNCQEFRDILYLFKKTKTVGYSDNQDVPSTWIPFVVDEGIGAPVHGIGTVLDSGGVSADFLLIADFTGVILFNGSYTKPELSWKIRDFWLALDRTSFREIEVINDSISEIMYIVLPTNNMLIGNYANGLSPEDIRWSKWSFNFPITSVEIINTSTILIGGTVDASSYSGLYQLSVGLAHDRLYNTSNTITNFKIPEPLIQTAYIHISEEENITHFTAVRMRVLGTGSLVMRMLSLSNTITLDLTALTMATTTNKESQRLMNFMESRASLEIKTTVIDSIFRINRIILFAKEVFSEYPA